jgi:pimeloyl-ACP methyl ester carboxylesterase
MTGRQAYEERSVALAHGALTWLEAGHGDAVVLLHGVGSAARSFHAQLEGLSRRWRVLAWNAPGYGASTGFAADAPDVGDYADAVAQWLDATSITACHLVGHSLGSLIAARFAADYPARVKSLTLASCAVGHTRLPEETRAKLLAGRLEDVATLGPRAMAEKRGPRLLGPDASPEAIRAVVDVMGLIDPSGYAQAARMLSGGDMLDDLARLPAAMPVQIVYGTADVITPPDVNLRAAAARPGASVTTIERAGHALYVEVPERFNAILESFMEARR